MFRAALLACLLLAPASAAADLAWSYPAASWLALRIEPGRDATVFVNALDREGDGSLGILQLTADGAWVDQFIGFETGTRWPEVWAQEHRVALDDTLPRPVRTTSGLGMTVRPTTGLLVLWTSGELGAWAARLEGSPVVLALAEGERTVFLSSKDFQGTLSAGARVSDIVGSGHDTVRAQVETRAQVEAEGILLGAAQLETGIFRYHWGYDRLYMERGGVERYCNLACGLRDFSMVGVPASFRLTGASAQASDQSEVTVSAADVTFPPGFVD